MTGRVRIHPTAEVSPEAEIGEGTSIWHYVQIRERARIGRACILGKGVYVDSDVVIGDNCKLQNGVSVYRPAALEDGVFLGPGVIITNDKFPRAINPDGSLKRDADWEVGPVTVGYGASIGAGAIILPNVRVGRFAVVGSGAVVSKDVPDHALVIGVPARLVGYACRCGRPMEACGEGYRCPLCGELYRLEASYPAD